MHVQFPPGSWLGGSVVHQCIERAGGQAPFELPAEASFEDYLGTRWKEDEVSEAYLDPLSLKGAPKPMRRASADEVRTQLHAT